MRLFVLLLPWLELFTLIQLGVMTSALTALMYVFATFLLGLAVIRRQGQGMFRQLREAQEGRILGPELLVDDMAMGFAGVLLMIPGLMTDLAARLVMVGPLRRRLVRALKGPQPERFAPEREQHFHETFEQGFGESSEQRPSASHSETQHQTLEGSFRRLDDD